MSWRSTSSNTLGQSSIGGERRSDILKLILYDLNSAIAPQNHRILALQTAISEFDHDEDHKHDEELDLHADKILFQKLSFAFQVDRSSEEVAMICTALEMVYRASRQRVALSFTELRESVLPIFVEMLGKPLHLRKQEELDRVLTEQEEKYASWGDKSSSGSSYDQRPKVRRGRAYDSAQSYSSTSESETYYSYEGPKKAHKPQPDDQSVLTYEEQSVKENYKGHSDKSYSTYDEPSVSKQSKDFDEESYQSYGPSVVKPSKSQDDYDTYDEGNRDDGTFQKYDDGGTYDNTHGETYQNDDGTYAHTRDDGTFQTYDDTGTYDRTRDDGTFQTYDDNGTHDRTRDDRTFQTYDDGGTYDDRTRGTLDDGGTYDDRTRGTLDDGGTYGDRTYDDGGTYNERDDGTFQTYDEEGTYDRSRSEGTFQTYDRSLSQAPSQYGDEGTRQTYERSLSHAPSGQYDDQTYQSYEDQTYDESYAEKDEDVTRIRGGGISNEENSQNDDSSYGDGTYGGSYGDGTTDDNTYVDGSYDEGTYSDVTSTADKTYDDGTHGRTSRSDMSDADRTYDEGSYQDQSYKYSTDDGTYAYGNEDMTYDGQTTIKTEEQSYTGDNLMKKGSNGGNSYNEESTYSGEQSYDQDDMSEFTEDYESNADYSVQKEKHVYEGEGASQSRSNASSSRAPPSKTSRSGKKDYDTSVRSGVLSTVAEESEEFSASTSSHSLAKSAGSSTMMSETQKSMPTFQESLRSRTSRSSTSSASSTTGTRYVMEKKMEKERNLNERVAKLEAELEIIRVEDTTNPVAVSRALQVLRYFSRILSAMVPMAHHPGLLDSLVYQLERQPYGKHADHFNEYDDGEPRAEEDKEELSASRVDAIATIVNLACAEENKIKMASNHSLLDAVIRVAQCDPSEEAREHAAIVLMNLAYEDENKEMMVQHPSMLETLVKLIQDNSPFTRRYSSAAMFTLACVAGNTEKMSSYCEGQILECLRRVLSDDPVDEARINAAEALFNMARNNTEETVQAMGDHPRLLATLAKAVLTDYSADVRVFCARALEWMAAGIHYPMDCHPLLLSALVVSAQWTKTSCIAEAMKTQSSLSENRLPMASHDGLLQALSNLALLDALVDSDVRKTALASLEMISREPKARSYMVKNEQVMRAMSKAPFEHSDQEVYGEDSQGLAVTNKLLKEAMKNLSIEM
eukprot:CAMPEP_0178897980 /NCGR_PEP_ID=MMETSP0786-20121207/2066_1 /TAXON_ID=186022 /ORGANISM="Thalassionema frauenfeldii, Strain CCMP 1798" /LENGTH=1189 /DNA_ID=CAMNT_0020568627 /DNA_START=198 /DNA_END=3770 /DNA_ORIENTATION=-